MTTPAGPARDDAFAAPARATEPLTVTGALRAVHLHAVEPAPTPVRPTVLTTVADARAALADRDVVLVPTMGALHEGHLALVDHALEQGGTVVVSIFVNPLQFGETADLDRYPRELDADLDLLAERGVPFVFAPDAAEVYPAGEPIAQQSAGAVGQRFEGRSRPGHFDGVLTVVARLFDVLGSRVAVFGQKDAQQVFLVRRMVAELGLPVRVDEVETVRDDDGLALSSRNRFLKPWERRGALTLSRALDAAASGADRGIDAVLAGAQAVFAGETEADLDYLAVVDPATFLGVSDDHRGRATVVVAARVGDVRLIDAEHVYIGG